MDSGMLMAKKEFDSKPTPIKEEGAIVNTMNTRNHIKPTQILRRKFTPIPIPLSQVYIQLKKDNVLHPKEPMLWYRPRKSDPDAHCEYHMGQQGHVTDNYWELKNKI